MTRTYADGYHDGIRDALVALMEDSCPKCRRKLGRLIQEQLARLDAAEATEPKPEGQLGLFGGGAS